MIKYVICSVLDAYFINCNILNYSRITSKDLFPGTDYHEILKLNKKCIINLDTLGLYKTPASCLDLITKML